MGSSLRKELFGDDDESDTNSEVNEVQSAQESTNEVKHVDVNRKESRKARKDYEVFIDGQQDYIENEKEKQIQIKSDRSEVKHIASDILYRLCTYCDITIQQTIDLLHYGADPNFAPPGSRGNTLLHVLARRGISPESVEALLGAGAIAHSLNGFNQTPLMLACDTVRTGPTLKIVKLLCNVKSGLNLEWRDVGGNSALLNAIFRSNPWVCR